MPGTRLALGGLIFLTFLFISILVAVFVLDQANHKDKVSRHITLAGERIGGLNQTELRSTVEKLATRYQDTSVVVGDKESTFSVPAKAVSLTLDKASTLDTALRTGKDGNAIGRFGWWLSGFMSANKSRVQINFDDSKLRDAIARGDQGPRSAAVEPSFVLDHNRLIAVDGANGNGIDVEDAATKLYEKASAGTPIQLRLQRKPIKPRYTKGDAERLANDVEANALSPLELRAGTMSKTVDATAMRPWITTAPGPTSLEVHVDTTKLGRDLEKLFPNAGTQPQEPSWTVIANQPVVSSGRDGTVCCDPSAPSAVGDAVLARIRAATVATPVDVPLRAARPSTTEEDIPKLGIIESIGTFTTNHAAGQPRVENIHRIADLVRGHVIKPGETFSLNGYVGERTTDKGFVVDHVIEDGKFAEAVGGGISQFATTLFNASFFGGLDYGEYQAHTIYISRYPYGREATVAYPHPDLQIRNTTPYGVLIWPSYTATSITVTLYSTHYAAGEQTGQSTAPRGACTHVTTERTRSYADGHTAVDTVNATYQPEEGKKC